MIYGILCNISFLKISSHFTLSEFYESFNTPYSYTKIGSIKNTEGLSQAVGKGSITVKFSKSE